MHDNSDRREVHDCEKWNFRFRFRHRFTRNLKAIVTVWWISTCSFKAKTPSSLATITGCKRNESLELTEQTTLKRLRDFRIWPLKFWPRKFDQPCTGVSLPCPTALACYTPYQLIGPSNMCHDILKHTSMTENQKPQHCILQPDVTIPRLQNQSHTLSLSLLAKCQCHENDEKSILHFRWLS